jgi:hypothetical protein
METAVGQSPNEGHSPGFGETRRRGKPRLTSGGEAAACQIHHRRGRCPEMPINTLSFARSCFYSASLGPFEVIAAVVGVHIGRSEAAKPTAVMLRSRPQ